MALNLGFRPFYERNSEGRTPNNWCRQNNIMWEELWCTYERGFECSSGGSKAWLCRLGSRGVVKRTGSQTKLCLIITSKTVHVDWDEFLHLSKPQFQVIYLPYWIRENGIIHVKNKGRTEYETQISVFAASVLVCSPSRLQIRSEQPGASVMPGRLLPSPLLLSVQPALSLCLPSLIL